MKELRGGSPRANKTRQFLEDENEQLRGELKALREQMRWIPVSERLPEMDGTLYLTNSAGYTGINAFKNGVDTDTAQGQAIWYNFARHGFGITHWRALGPGPEGGK